MPSPAPAPQDSGNPEVNLWVQRTMLGLLSLVMVIALAYFGWSIPTLLSISQSVQTYGVEQGHAKQEIARLVSSHDGMKRSLDEVSRQSLTWATRDQVRDTKDSLLLRIDQVQGEVNELRLEVTRLQGKSR